MRVSFQHGVERIEHLANRLQEFDLPGVPLRYFFPYAFYIAHVVSFVGLVFFYLQFIAAVSASKCRKNAVSIAVALNPSIISEITDGPTKKYYGEYNRVNSLLADLCNHAVDIIIKEGHKAVALEATIKVVDLSNINEHLPHKTAATKALPSRMFRT